MADPCEKLSGFGEAASVTEQALALRGLLEYTEPAEKLDGVIVELIGAFGSARAVLSADYDSLRSVRGLSEKGRELLFLMQNIYIHTQRGKKLIKAVGMNVDASMIGRSGFEEIWIMGIDSENVRTDPVRMSCGSEVLSDIRIEDILRFAELRELRYVTLLHTHPGMKLAYPSEEDLSATKYIGDFLGKHGIVLLEHIILADEDSYSIDYNKYAYKMNRSRARKP